MIIHVFYTNQEHSVYIYSNFLKDLEHILKFRQIHQDKQTKEKMHIIIIQKSVLGCTTGFVESFFPIFLKRFSAHFWASFFLSWTFATTFFIFRTPTTPFFISRISATSTITPSVIIVSGWTSSIFTLSIFIIFAVFWISASWFLKKN